MAGVIVLPVSKIGLDPQAAVERELKVGEPQVSSWFQEASFSPKNCFTAY